MYKFKKGKPYFISFLAMVLFIGVYFFFLHSRPDSVSDIVMTILAIIAGVAFWLEYHHNSKITEAQFIIELNNQFIKDKNMAKVEHILERYYALVKENAAEETIIDKEKEIKDYFDINKIERQYLVNYLVHLEGVATLINNDVLKLNSISDLMAYRFFIAVNNPVVQKLELEPYRDYYKGIDQLFDKWFNLVNPLPLEKTAWKKK